MALNDISNRIKLMGDLVGENEADKLKAMTMPLVYECSSFFPVMGSLIKETAQYNNQVEGVNVQKQIAVMRTNFVQFKETARNQILPVLFEREQELKAEGDSYLDEMEALRLYTALASYYVGIEHDTLKAESYIRILQKSNNPNVRYRVAREMAEMKVAQKDFAEAFKWYEEQKELASHVPLITSSIQNMADYFSSLCVACLLGGFYHEAIAPAKEQFRLRRQLANLNFDLLTQVERESFIQNGGVGGANIIFLLPKFPQELSKDGYDVVLASKGLLLRASERIKRAVMQSGNQVLKTKMDSLNQLRLRYRAISLMKDWEHGNFDYNPESVELSLQIEKLERNVNRQASQFIDSMNTPNWKELQRVLRPGEAAVEFVISDSLSCGALVLLPKREPQYVALTNSKKLWNDFISFNHLKDQRKAEILYQDDRLHLYDKLWKPMEHLLKRVKTVYYSPSGFLNELAFAAFKCSDGSYLSDHYELHQMLSTGDLVSIREKHDTSTVETASIYGSVFYSPEQESLVNDADRVGGNHVSEQGGRWVIQDDEPFAYLPFTKQEVEKVNDIVKTHQIKAVSKQGFDATEKSIHDISGSSPHILHLSTHGFFIKDVSEVVDNKFFARFPATRFSSMQRSGIAFVNANKSWAGSTDASEENDGILTANEVALLDLSNTQLAILSACQTAVGDYSMEGVFGLHRGFKQAGVRSILGSLWKVDDRSTSRLMELFYQDWLSGEPMQKSFHNAVSKLRKEYPSPYYWAPFVLMDAE
jgi:CHAT domain-containing protein